MNGETATWAGALAMGFFGSLHCAGMCGPIMMILPFRLFRGWKKAGAIALYHAGRISVYAAMGVLIHSFRHLFHPGVQQYVSIGLGILFLAAGILSFTGKGLTMPWQGFVRRQTGRFIGNPHPAALAIAGMLNGLLPCGLVYTALSLAVIADSSPQAAGLLYTFGLGTVPMLVAITLLGSRIKLSRMAAVRRAVPAIMLFFGAVFLLRGLALGIPYLSPAATVTGEGVESRCCHRP